MARDPLDILGRIRDAIAGHRSRSPIEHPPKSIHLEHLADDALGGGTTVAIEDEGIPKGAASIIDFVGAGVTASAVVAGQTTVTIPGGGGGGSPGVMGPPGVDGKDGEPGPMIPGPAGPTGAIDILTDVDTTADPPVKNECLKWNGSLWVPAAYDYSFTFSIASFSDGEGTTTLLIGTGVWRADEVMAYVATYNNGPPTTALVKMSINGGAYNEVGYMDSPNYLTGKNYDGAINYPSVDQYLRFRLDAGDGVDSDIEYDTAIYFYNYRFWGVITAAQRAALTEAIIESLSSELSNSTTITKTVNSGAGQYICVAFPARYATLLWGDDYEDDGNIDFNFNGVSIAMELLTSTLSITNSAGYAENYKVYAAYQPNLGNYSFQGGSAIAAINWLYWGELNKASGYTESDVESNYATQPGKVASNSISSRTMIVNCAANEYTYIAYPARLGALTSIMIGGFESIGDFNVDSTTLSITNENGWSENYRVYVSKNPGFTDPTTMIVTI